MNWWPFKRKETLPDTKQPASSAAPKTGCPYCPDAPEYTEDRDAYLAVIDKLDDLICNGKYTAALTV